MAPSDPLQRVRAGEPFQPSARAWNAFCDVAERSQLGRYHFGGGSGGDLPGLADPLILAPSTTTARIQEMHITIGQILCGALERRLGLV